MSFINEDVVAAAAPLKSVHFPFPRGKELYEVMSWCVTDYYTNASIGQPFEARGVMVIGESRQGKSTEITRMLADFNDGSVIMPDGRPAKIIHCKLSGIITWKDMGAKILPLLGYPLSTPRKQSEIWEKVVKYAELQGVVGIHFDECQHVFSTTGEITNQKILDSFKTLLKETSWPLMLILSGVPSLATHVAKEEQLARLLRTVHFEEIDLSRKSDMDELLQLTYSYAEKAGLDFAPLSTKDFFERLVFSCCDRWGLVIEMLIETFTRCRTIGDTVCAITHFSHTYAKTYSTPLGYSPFTMPNYRESFDQNKLLEILEQTKQSSR